MPIRHRLALILLSGVLLFCGSLPARAVSPEQPGLIPMPQKVKWKGKAMPIASVKITLPDLEANPLKKDQFIAELKGIFEGAGVKINQKKGTCPVIFKLGKVNAAIHRDEAYRLTIDERGIIVMANTVDGLHHSLQTIRQLVVTKDGRTTIPVCDIRDHPAFKIRGFMQDVGRNFQTIEQLKMQIDVMSAYKLNVFHWHLSDHYGWRLESKIYPDLTAESSATRDQGKFYSQEEFKEFVDYCWARGITVIPEFDTPGHSEAFRKGIGIENMKDPKAKDAIVALIGELCTLAPPERMPYIHIGTDEVRKAEERVDSDYLPALHNVVHKNKREVIGWWKGMGITDDTKQIQQTWAQSSPRSGLRHIDSRSNYVNHLEALDAAVRLMFQQPCRVPQGDDINLGGILCYWPDVRVADEKVGIRNSPILLSMVAYSEAVWTGIEEDKPEYWAKIPTAGTPEYEAYVGFENRLAEQRDRFLSDKPFLFVKTAQIPWQLLGPVAKSELAGLETQELKESYEENGSIYRWSDPVYGGAIHIRHFFGFKGHVEQIPRGKDVVWARTYIHSDEDREVDAWISFNTTSTSDNRAGAARTGSWNINPLCNIWINGEAVPAPEWKHPGKAEKEHPFTDEIYTSREPTKIQLKKGWNTVLVRSASRWKWVFTFTPIEWDGTVAREVDGLRFTAQPE